jgi:anthranilate phosphoribosyltransferase
VTARHGTAIAVHPVMLVAHAIKRLTGQVANERDLTETEALELMAALLDGGVAELEIGVLLGAMAMKSLAASELTGFRHATQARVNRVASSPDARPIVIPSYSGARAQANLMPLVALMLARFGVPVLVHGPLEGQGGIASASVFRELGVLPCGTLGEAQIALEASHIAFLPTALLCPALAQLISLRARLGVPTFVHEVASLIDPFAGEALLLVPAGDELRRDVLAPVLAGLGGYALLFHGREGEAYADPLRRPAMTLFGGSEEVTLFDAHALPAPAGAARAAALPEQPDARSTAAWIEAALAGRQLVPLPIANLLACCLFGAGYAEDFNQAKAIVAVRSHTLSAA